MDRIILSNHDIESLLSWRDQNKDLIRKNAAPFRGILLEFPESKIEIRAYNDAGKIAFYIRINGSSAGKIEGLQLPGGLLQVQKNTTKLKSDDVRSIITVYASLMALIVYHTLEEAAAAEERKQRQKKPKKTKSGAQRSKKGITYLFSSTRSGPRILPRGHHKSPAGVFTVRGHYRKYQDGRTVWIKPYKKGTGSTKNKTYKIN